MTMTEIMNMSNTEYFELNQISNNNLNEIYIIVNVKIYYDNVLYENII